MAAAPLMHDGVWLQQPRYEESEAYYHAVQAGTASPGQGGHQGGRGIKNEITQAREQIANALKQPGHHGGGGGGSGGGGNPQVQKRLDHLENENKDLRKTVSDMEALIRKLEGRVTSLEKGGKGVETPASKPAADVDDDDLDLFGDDDEEEEEDAAAASKKKAVEEYKAKKASKPQVIAKSSVILDVKPWDDETDMVEVERLVRTIEKDGLVWGVGRLVELAYGIKKLSIICVVVDDKISIEDLKEEIELFEDLVQSVDVAAFNKI